MSLIRSVAVLGAGTMGAQIAAHFANAGVPVLLLDMTAAVARDGLKRARGLKPDPFFTADAASLISTGGFDTDFARLATADWILEAVVEQLDVKRSLIERIEAIRQPGGIVTSNTSGLQLSVHRRGARRRVPPSLARHALLQPAPLPAAVEVIPTADTDPAVVARVSEFADRRLGKGVVVTKDTPNFIANRIGLLRRHLGAADARRRRADDRGHRRHHGPALGRPKSATFRTMDIAGLDVLGHVARNLLTQLPDGRGEAIRAAAARPVAHRRRDRLARRAGRVLQAREDGRMARRS